MYLSKACNVGNLCHEIMHALGLHHEHTRQDRDQYVIVQWGNILEGERAKGTRVGKNAALNTVFGLLEGKEKNFNINKGNTLDLPYDLKSIMHYGE